MGASGTTVVDFGAFPGLSDALVTITGQAGIVAGSLVEAWILPNASGDHTVAEHLVETIRVIAGDIVAGVGFTIFAMNSSQLGEPVQDAGIQGFRGSATSITSTAGAGSGGAGTLLNGKYTVAWVWV